MAKAVAITLFSLLSSGAFARPRPAPQNDAQATASKFQWQIWKACSQENKDMINQAWGDSKKLADALKSWKPKADFQPAMEMYMGDRCTYQDTLPTEPPHYNFPRQIQDTARRERGLYDGVSEYGNANLWVYCNEDSKWWSHCKEDETSAVLAYEQEDAVFNNWYITFCPAFYNPKWSLPLDTVIKTIKDRNLDPKVMENWYSVQAATFFHETMHMSQLVTSPQAKDKAYEPKEVYELARNRNTDAAVYNADSWTITAQAIFAQQEMNLDSPPYPFAYPPQGVTPGNVVDIANQKYLQSVLVNITDYVPEGAGDNPTKPYNVNPDLWEVYGAPPPPEQSPPPPQEPPVEPAGFEVIQAPKCINGANNGSPLSIVKGQCVKVWDGYNPGGEDWSAQYQPNAPYNCGNNCFAYPKGFGGIQAFGDGTKGTNCGYFSDLKCENRLGETGNVVSRKKDGIKVLDEASGQKAYSMQCYFNC